MDDQSFQQQSKYQKKIFFAGIVFVIAIVVYTLFVIFRSPQQKEEAKTENPTVKTENSVPLPMPPSEVFSEIDSNANISSSEPSTTSNVTSNPGVTSSSNNASSSSGSTSSTSSSTKKSSNNSSSSSSPTGQTPDVSAPSVKVNVAGPAVEVAPPVLPPPPPSDKD